MTLDERVAKIDELSAELLDHKNFVLLYPWVFVLVCKKEQKVGSIFLPDHQNKTVHEGIVLATWRDKLVERGTISKDGQRFTRCEILKSEMSLGDRVVFQHFAGKPVPGYNVDRFRVVKERDWSFDKEGGIFGRIELDEDNTMDTIMAMIDKIAPLESAEMTMARAAIEGRFVIVDREAGSVTLSGK